MSGIGKGTTFSVRLEPGGHMLSIPEGKSVLDAALQGGVSLPYSCRTGLCKTCKGTVVSGHLHGALADTDNSGVADAAEVGVGDVVLLCRSVPLTDCVLHVPEAKDLEFKPELMPARIANVIKPTTSVAVLRLRLPMNRRLNFRAGQYLNVLLQDGTRRSYSIASLPLVGGITDVELHVRHHPSGYFSGRLFSGQLPPGLLQIEGPLGSFYLRDDESGPIVLLATGTGFAPIQAMVEDAIRKGRTQRQSFHVYWGARRETDFYALSQATGWERENVRFTRVLSGADSPDWDGRRGHVQHAVKEDFADLGNAHVYACGSDSMVTSARRELVGERNLIEERFFADAFYASR